jgi:hypothetical protein
MKKISYAGYRFPPEIIQQAMWLYLRFTLSFRDVEDLLAERGVTVSYETIRRWVNHFGPMIAADLRKRRPKPHTTWHLADIAHLVSDAQLVHQLGRPFVFSDVHAVFEVAPGNGTTGLVGRSLLRMAWNGAEHDEGEAED